MKKLIILILIYINVFSQVGHEFKASIDQSFLNNRLSASKYSANLTELSFSKYSYKIQLLFRSNYDQQFRITPEPIELREPIITNIDNLGDLTFNPDIYYFNSAFRLKSVFYYDNFNVEFDAYQVEERNTIEEIEVIGNSLILSRVDLERISYYTNIAAKISFQHIDISAGIRQIPISNGDSNLKYRINADVYPFIKPQFKFGQTQFALRISKFESGLSLSEEFCDLSLRFNADYSHFSQTESSLLSLAASYDLNPGLRLRAAFKSYNRGKSTFNRQTFLSTLAEGYSDYLNDYSEFKLGIAYTLNFDQSLNDLETQTAFSDDAIYLSKRRFYENNAIGYVSLINTSEEKLRLSVQLASNDNYFQYKSDFIELNQGDSARIPLHLYMNTIDLDQRKESKLLEVSLLIDEQSHVIKRQSLDVFDQNYWNGQTDDLFYFLQADHPKIRENATKIYRETNNKDATTDAQLKFGRLKMFLSQIAKDNSYVTDPVQSIYVDEVRYPVELMQSRAGDCEDLLVYYMSHLMAIGHQSAIIALKPKKDQSIGHVFLMVDTSIPSQLKDELDLNDISAISRRNYLGNVTIWIPIEVTNLHEGFDQAFKAGVRQYYDEVILKQGIQKGNVSIIEGF